MASSARIDELRKKFEENPRRYFAPLANEYRKAGDVDQAIAICREYLPQQPGHMSGHIVYGQALYEARQFEEGKTVFETALALDPENLIALRHLGDIALILGDTSAARTWYSRVLEADPRNEEIQAQLKSLESLEGSATPATSPAATPTPAVASPAVPATPVADAAPEEPAKPEPEAAPLLDMVDLERPAAPPSSSAPTVVISAMPQPPRIERTVEQEAVQIPQVESLSTAATTEIVLDDVATPSIPDAQDLAPTTSDPLSGTLDAAPGFEPTSPPVEPPGATAPPAMVELEGPMGGPAEAPAIDSFTLEGLETTSMGEAAAALLPEPPGTPDVPLELSTEPSPALEVGPGLPEESEKAPDVWLEAASEPSLPSDLPLDLPSAESRQTPHIPLDLSAQESEKSNVLEIIPPPPDDDAGAPAAMTEGSPFVTETMAELYEQQGHRDEALRVYRALLDQRPDDVTLRRRIEALEEKRGPSIRELLARIAARRPSLPLATAPAAAPESTATPQVSAVPEPPSTAVAEPPIGEAPTEPMVPAAPEPRAESPAETPTEIMAPAAEAPRGDALAAFLGATEASRESEAAAKVLATAFTFDNHNGADRSSDGSTIPGAPARPAARDLSLDAVFSGTDDARPQPSNFSFDQFFSERATAESGGGAVASGGQESRDDVAKFTQWLEGLKQK